MERGDASAARRCFHRLMVLVSNDGDEDAPDSDEASDSISEEDDDDDHAASFFN